MHVNETVKVSCAVYSDFILSIALGSLLVWVVSMFIYLLVTSVSLPVVSFSNSTGECVSVEPGGSCDMVPTKYIHQWVE